MHVDALHQKVMGLIPGCLAGWLASSSPKTWTRGSLATTQVSVGWSVEAGLYDRVFSM